MLIAGSADQDWFGRADGNSDTVVFLVSPEGTIVRGLQMGTAGPEWFSDVATDASGRVFLSGVTAGGLYGPNPEGSVQPVLLVSDASLFVSAALQLNVTGETSDGAVAVGSDDGALYVLDSAGGFRWSYATGSLVGSSPAVDAGGRLFVGSFDKRFYSFAPDGSMEWSWAMGDAVRSSAAIGQDDLTASPIAQHHSMEPSGANE